MLFVWPQRSLASLVLLFGVLALADILILLAFEARGFVKRVKTMVSAA